MIEYKKITFMLIITIFLINLISPSNNLISPSNYNQPMPENNILTNPSEKPDEPKENYFLVIEYFNQTLGGRKLFKKHWKIEEMCNRLDNITKLFYQEECSFSLNWSQKESCPANTKIFLDICYKKEIFDKKSWGNLCDYDFECESDFCHEGKCYHGGREAFDDKLEERLQILEKESSEKKEYNNSKITGEVVEPIKKQNWLEKILEVILNIFRKN